MDIASEEKQNEIVDPGPIPDRLLSVPGLVNKIRDYTLETAPYPDKALAFTSALSFMGFLGGRKICDEFDNRTNSYFVALANSGVGKDYPRKVVQKILFEAGIHNSVSDAFASGEGIEDRLFTTPNVLFQTDEIDGMMNAINKGRDPRYEAIMGVLMKINTSANSIYPMRVKAGRDNSYINQPSLSLFGTAIPMHFYGAISEKMTTNGFLARITVTEAGTRGKYSNAKKRPIPKEIVDIVKWWRDFVPGDGNLGILNPTPKVVMMTKEAEAIMVTYCEHADQQYTKAETCEDIAAMALWARAGEKARRFCLCYAISENHLDPKITANAARWATEFVDHQTKRMLFMIQTHLSANPFDRQCMKLLQKLRSAPKKMLPHKKLLNAYRGPAKDFRDMIDTLMEGGAIRRTGRGVPGDPIFYHLVGR